MTKIGIALSGGGIRAFSQLPILAALHREGVKIDAISGTSMGSVIAALYASGADIETVKEVALELEKEIQDKKIMSRPSMKLLPFSKDKLVGGLVDGQDLEDVLDVYLEKLGLHMIQDAKIPLAINAVDIITGRTIMFVSHPELYQNSDPETIVIDTIKLSTAVRASCSFPFVIAATPFEKMMLVDGGVRQNLPLVPIKDYGVDRTIAITMHSNEPFKDFDSMIGLGTRVMDIMRIEADQLVQKQADVHINIPLDKVGIFEIGRGQFTMIQGARVIRYHMDDIRKLTKKETWFDRLKRR